MKEENNLTSLQVRPELILVITQNVFSLVWFYGVSTIVGYLIPNPLYTYISNIYIWFENIVNNILK